VPDWVVVDKTAKLSVLTANPVNVGTYDFMIQAKEPSTGFQDESVKF
jgi:hypothetical protein